MLLICDVIVLLYIIVVYTDRIESSITNLKEELLSTHQQQHIFSPVKEAEMETQDLLNKPSKISSEEVYYIIFILFSFYL